MKKIHVDQQTCGTGKSSTLDNQAGHYEEPIVEKRASERHVEVPQIPAVLQAQAEEIPSEAAQLPQILNQVEEEIPAYQVEASCDWDVVRIKVRNFLSHG